VIICKRCHGYVDTSYTGISDFDPYCINCGCSYPELNTFKQQKRKRLRHAIRYTGKTHDMKNLLGYITYVEHPNRGSLYPMLIVECPSCTKKSEVLTPSTNPSTSTQNGYNENTEFVDGYKIAKQFIKCPTGHLFRLKVDKKGLYSWE